ncbi:MAG: SDR family oxidoreductase [Pseudomonadota bacterium]
MTDLNGKTALVTGAASGIGRATALQLGNAGASVMVLDQNSDGIGKVCEEIGESATGVPFDLNQITDIPDLVTSLIQERTGIDILINCAGYRGDHQPLGKVDLETWNRTQAINVTAPMLLIQEIAPGMIEHGKGGRIINVSSGAAQVAGYAPAYSCSKAALNQLTRSAAGRYGRYGINVNSVAPGLVETPGIETVSNLEDAVKRGGRMANLLEQVTQPEDVAELIVFLCLPASSHITGQTIGINAGAMV